MTERSDNEIATSDHGPDGGYSHGSGGRGGIRLLALGGFGEIGQNCTVLERDDERFVAAEPSGGVQNRVRRVMIDCGVRFGVPDGGVEFTHPRFDCVLNDPETLGSVVLTHGHEDHVGALGYLLQGLIEAGRKSPLRIWGSPYALAMAEARLLEAQIVTDRYQLAVLEPNKSQVVSGWAITPIPVAHSIAQAYALCFDTSAGRILHTGDFKLAHGDEEADVFGQLGPVRLLLSDSTGVLRAGFSNKEQDVSTALDAQIAKAKGRVFISVFASNTHRLRAIGQAAQRHGRKLCLLGLSVNRHADAGRALNELTWPDGLRVSHERARELPDRDVLYVASGTQGEPRGSMRRLASSTHSATRLKPEDTVLMSSRIIPGNERAVFRMLDDLLGQGVELVTRIEAPEIHATGHACRAELEAVIARVAPTSFIPLHGTRMHLKAHAALARAAGIVDMLILENGGVAQLSAASPLKRGEDVVAGSVSRAGRQLIDAATIRERLRNSRYGLVVVFVDRTTRWVHATTSGVPGGEDTEHTATAAGRRALDNEAKSSDEQAREMIRRAVRRAVEEVTGYRPPVRVILSSDTPQS